MPYEKLDLFESLSVTIEKSDHFLSLRSQKSNLFLALSVLIKKPDHFQQVDPQKSDLPTSTISDLQKV